VRYTTFLFTTLCTSIQNFGDFHVQTGAQWNIFEPERAPRRDIAHLRAALAPAPPALSVRTAAPPEAARRPRPRLPQAARIPWCLEVSTPRASPPFATYHARRAPRWPPVRPQLPSPVCAPTEAAAVPRSDLRHPSSRARESRLFKGRPPLRRAMPVPPRHWHHHRRVPFSARGRHCLSMPTWPWVPTEASPAAFSPDRALTSPEPRPPRPPLLGVGKHHRRLPLRPNSGYKQALGELAHLSALLRGQERRRCRRNSGRPRRPHPTPKGNIARHFSFLGSFV
jgi:hypothetical protein